MKSNKKDSQFHFLSEASGTTIPEIYIVEAQFLDQDVKNMRRHIDLRSRSGFTLWTEQFLFVEGAYYSGPSISSLSFE